MPDAGGLSIKSETVSDNRRVRLARLPLDAIIAPFSAISERFNQGASYVAAFPIFGLSDAWLLFWERPIIHSFEAIYRFVSILPQKNDASIYDR